MGHKQLSELKNEERADSEANESLLPTSQLDEYQAEATHSPWPDGTLKQEWKTYLKRSSLGLVVTSLIIYAFFMGVLVGIHWKNRVTDVVCFDRTSRPCMLINGKSGIHC
jgi:hypothetical protein